jgi:Phosphodiester glycosidase
MSSFSSYTKYILTILLVAVVSMCLPMPVAKAYSELDSGKEIRLKVSGEPGAKIFLNDQNTNQIIPTSGNIDLVTGTSECGKTYSYKITLQDSVGNFSEQQTVTLKAKPCPVKVQSRYFSAGLPANLTNEMRKAGFEEAKDKIISFISSNYEDSTEIDNLNQDIKRLGEVKNVLQDKLNIHEWCNIWVQDLGYIKEKNGGEGYDGIIVYNPIGRNAYQVKNGIWEKYRNAGGPCGRLGVPANTWGSNTENTAGIPKGSRATRAVGQVFETQAYRQNSIYWYEWKEGRCWGLFGSCSFKNEAFFTVDTVASQYWSAGGSWSEFGFPIGDTYSFECGGRQLFEFSTQIDLCKLNQGVNYTAKDGDYILVVNLKDPNQVCFKSHVGLENKVGEKDSNGSLIKNFKASSFGELVTDHNAYLNGSLPIAAFNTDFVSKTGMPLDINFVQGNDYSGDRNWSSMDVSKDNKVSFVNSKSNSLYNTAGGGPRIYDGNGLFKQPGINELGRFAYLRNTRTVAVVTNDQRMIVIVSNHLELGKMQKAVDDIAKTYYDQVYDGEMFDGGGSPGLYYNGNVKRQGNNKISAAMLIFEGEACISR